MGSSGSDVLGIEPQETGPGPLHDFGRDYRTRSWLRGGG